MNLSYGLPPSRLDWTSDLFTYIQAVKAGTFDGSAAYQQFGWLILPEVTAHGDSGPFTAYFAVKAGGAFNSFSVLNPITDVSVWNVVSGAPETNLLYASGLSLSFASVLGASSATVLEKLIFSGDDRITFLPATPDRGNDLVRGWAGNDDIEILGSGGNDTVYGGTGNDRISIRDLNPNTLGGVPGTFWGYGEAGNDTIFGDDRGDLLFGGSGRDLLAGNDGKDSIDGGTGNDSLYGNAGNDTLTGGAGSDVIFGYTGADVLTGGSEADLFVFTWGGAVPHFDSTGGVKGRDVVTDFEAGDLIRLVESTLAEVTLIGAAAFTAINQVRWVSGVGGTTIYINGDADLAPELNIFLMGVAGLTVDDFQLG